MTLLLRHTASRSGRSAVLSSAAALALVVVAPTGPSDASAARVTPFSFTVQETFSDSPPECMPELKAGVTNATETISGQVVETDNGVSIHGGGMFDYRTDFADGSYLTGAAQEHFTVQNHHGQAVMTDVIQEPRTVYSADGAPIGRVLIHALSHSVTDTKSGRTTASIDRFYFTCA
jgi:hypothetical protein